VLRRLSGVKGVTNLIVVKSKVTPSDLKKKIEDALVRTAELDAKNITVEVDGGKITLKGTVRSWANGRKPSVRPGLPRALHQWTTVSPFRTDARGNSPKGRRRCRHETVGLAGALAVRPFCRFQLGSRH